MVVKGSQVFIPMLNAPLASRVAIQLNSVGARYCALFPGQQGLIKKNDPTLGVFLALHAEANSMPCSQLID